MGDKYSDVRLAVIEDREKVKELTTLLHGENGLFSISPTKVDQMLDRFYNREGALIGVIGEVGNPVATIYLGIDQPIYTDEFALIEQWNFVHPDHRRSDYASQLICYAKNLSDKFRLPLMVGILSNSRTEAKARLYERHLSKAGYYFIYNQQHLSSAAPAWQG